MNLRKIAKYLVIGFLALIALYILIMLGSMLFMQHQMENAQSGVQDRQEQMQSQFQTDVEITSVFIQDSEYQINIRNMGTSEVRTSNLDIQADGEDITSQASFSTDILAPGDTATVDTGYEAGSNVEFEIVSSGSIISGYRCDYTEGAQTC